MKASHPLLAGMVLAAALWVTAAAQAAEGPSLPAGLLAGQWEDMGSSGGGANGGESGKKKSEFVFGAAVVLDTSGREVECNACRGPGGPAAFLVSPYQHSQVNQDAESYLTYTSWALEGLATWSPMANLTLEAELRLGTAWITLDYEVGSGSPWGLGGYPDTSSQISTSMGFPLLGWDLGGRYLVGDGLSLFGSWRFTFATANFDSTFFGWAIGKGHYRFTEQALRAGAAYDFGLAEPCLGFALTFHNAWALLDETANGSTREWLLDYREAQWFTLFVGARKEFDAGHYVRVEFSFIGEFRAQCVVGFLL